MEQRWAEIESVYHAALAKDPNERDAFLQEACSGDLALRSEVESLLGFAGTDLPSAPDLTNWTSILHATHFPSAAFKPNQVVAGRFEIVREIGSGGMGVVYEAFDRNLNAAVALKKVLRFDPRHLLRFKSEFRSLVDLPHLNLVQLYELFVEDDQCFFTMELVDGVNFLHYVRAGNWERLRHSLFQLATGVQFLHSSARLHRDLKPSNILVNADGRVVILDFGLVKEIEEQTVEQTLGLAGSPSYMAPEHATGGAVGEAADWYSVGVILYEALTGQLPFAGEWAEVLQRKQNTTAPRSQDLAPAAPDDLHEACEHLLQRDPDARAKGVSILLAQGRHDEQKFDRSQEEFVGRQAQLTLLQDRFDALRSGKHQVALVSGLSGIGKSSLLAHFLSGLQRERPNAVILKGRCRESETLLYKAIDPIADALVRHLRALPKAAATELLPRHPELLRRLFPVFGELEILAAFPDRSLQNIDEQQIRRRAFETFCDLLGRLSDRTPVVIWIDDLQWADLDSIAFLAELTRPANAPALLLILAFRSEESVTSAALRALQTLRTESWVALEIKGLSEGESRDLLHVFQTRGKAIASEQSRDIIHESGGSPLLLSELVRFAASETKERAQGVLIADMIRHRASNLSATARHLLEAVAVAGEPVPRSLLYRSVKGSGDDPTRDTALLIYEHLLRASSGSDSPAVEPFHDQVREATLSWLSAGELGAWHAHWAAVLQGEHGVDPQRLLRHHRGAGNLSAALEAALAAAENSETALAFDQAAHFYAEALETGRADEALQAKLHQKRAEALAKAGRGYESAQDYLQAATWPSHNDPLEMRRLATEQLMRSGYMDEGTEMLAGLLRSMGVFVPATRVGRLLCQLAMRFLIRLRGLQWRERAEADISHETLRRLDLLWSGALSLVSSEVIFGSYVQAVHMRQTLEMGEPRRLSLTFGLAAVYESLGGNDEYEHAQKLLILSEQLGVPFRDPYWLGLRYSYLFGVDYMCGRIADGLVHCEAAAVGFAETRGRAKAFELSTMNMLAVWFLGWGGRIRELSARLPLIVEEARSRGDVFAEVSVQCGATSHLPYLASDQAPLAMEEAARSLRQWRQVSYHMQHFFTMTARVECLLYDGRCQEARQLLVSHLGDIRRSFFTRKCQTNRTIFYYARGRTALALWLTDPTNRGMRRETERSAGKLAKFGSPWGDAISKMLRAGLMAGSQRRTEAVKLLEEAEVILREQDLRLLAAAVLRRRGELLGASGEEQISAADAFMKSETIVRPERMTAMILPGDWLRSDAG